MISLRFYEWLLAEILEQLAGVVLTPEPVDELVARQDPSRVHTTSGQVPPGVLLSARPGETVLILEAAGGRWPLGRDPRERAALPFRRAGPIPIRRDVAAPGMLPPVMNEYTNVAAELKPTEYKAEDATGNLYELVLLPSLTLTFDPSTKFFMFKGQPASHLPAQKAVRKFFGFDSIADPLVLEGKAALVDMPAFHYPFSTQRIAGRDETFGVPLPYQWNDAHYSMNLSVVELTGGMWDFLLGGPDRVTLPTFFANQYFQAALGSPFKYFITPIMRNEPVGVAGETGTPFPITYDFPVPRGINSGDPTVVWPFTHALTNTPAHLFFEGGSAAAGFSVKAWKYVFSEALPSFDLDITFGYGQACVVQGEDTICFQAIPNWSNVWEVKRLGGTVGPLTYFESKNFWYDQPALDLPERLPQMEFSFTSKEPIILVDVAFVYEHAAQALTIRVAMGVGEYADANWDLWRTAQGEEPVVGNKDSSGVSYVFGGFFWQDPAGAPLSSPFATAFGKASMWPLGFASTVTTAEIKEWFAWPKDLLALNSLRNAHGVGDLHQDKQMTGGAGSTFDGETFTISSATAPSIPTEGSFVWNDFRPANHPGYMRFSHQEHVDAADMTDGLERTLGRVLTFVRPGSFDIEVWTPPWYPAPHLITNSPWLRFIGAHLHDTMDRAAVLEFLGLAGSQIRDDGPTMPRPGNGVVAWQAISIDTDQPYSADAILDGEDRLLAAVVRGDETIEISIDGTSAYSGTLATFLSPDLYATFGTWAAQERTPSPSTQALHPDWPHRLGVWRYGDRWLVLRPSSAADRRHLGHAAPVVVASIEPVSLVGP